jgi:NAD(P)-dependent dehydrogenase (short-subunit alcohol dehydrogenase family)
MDFKGKHILVVGGSSGIGKQTALNLANLGAAISIIGRNAFRVNETLSKLNEINSSIKHTGHIFDLVKIESISTLVNELGNYNGLVYSAGIQKISPLQFINNQDFAEVQYINSFAPFFLIRDLIKLKKINKEASIVLVSSVSGAKIGTKGLISYATSKSALVGMSKSLALELARQKIRVNCVLPGMIKDTLLNNIFNFSEEQLLEDKKKYPLGDYGTCQDVSNAICFLLSDLSKYITGSELVIDGGLTLN